MGGKPKDRYNVRVSLWKGLWWPLSFWVNTIDNCNYICYTFGTHPPTMKTHQYQIRIPNELRKRAEEVNPFAHLSQYIILALHNQIKKDSK